LFATQRSAIAEASVTLRNVDTTIERKTVSNDAGNYVFLNLGPGKYAWKRQLPASRPSVSLSSFSQ